jgi:hypothetical protein
VNSTPNVKHRIHASTEALKINNPNPNPNTGNYCKPQTQINILASASLNLKHFSLSASNFLSFHTFLPHILPHKKLKLPSSPSRTPDSSVSNFMI